MRFGVVVVVVVVVVFFFVFFVCTRFRGHDALFSGFCALFMGLTNTLLRKNIKNGFHGTIHTFKNYFTTMFLVMHYLVDSVHCSWDSQVLY